MTEKQPNANPKADPNAKPPVNPKGPSGAAGEVEVRELAELRQDTMEKQAEALAHRIQYFDAQREIPLQEKVEDFLAGAIQAVVRVKNEVEKVVPAEVRAKALTLFEQLLLAF